MATQHGADSADGRDETTAERMDRNWEEILQELRVTQTGTQILTGFLLTIPFQQRFGDLEPHQVGIYLALVAVSALATLAAIAPISLHRALFRRHRKPEVVELAHWFMRVALVALAVALTGVVWLIVDVVLGTVPGAVAASAAGLLALLAWLIVPLAIRTRSAADEPRPEG